jgi:hypothetical protein
MKLLIKGTHCTKEWFQVPFLSITNNNVHTVCLPGPLMSLSQLYGLGIFYGITLFPNAYEDLEESARRVPRRRCVCVSCLLERIYKYPCIPSSSTKQENLAAARASRKRWTEKLSCSQKAQSPIEDARLDSDAALYP